MHYTLKLSKIIIISFAYDYRLIKNPLVVINGTTKEVGNLEKKFDKNFDAVIGSFGGKVQFIQAVTLKVNTKTKLTGTIEYMVCNEERCLPPTKQSFEVDIQ